MPSEAHDQRRLSAMSASFEHDPFSEARRSHGQKEIGFWKSESNPDRDGMARAIVSRNKPVTNFQSMPIGSHQSLAPQQSYFIREQNGIHGLQHLMGSEKKSVSTWKSTDFNFDFLFNLQSKPLNAKQNGSVDPGVLHENSLFSNSLPETFSQKVTSSSRNVLFHQQTDELQSNLNEDGPFESLQEMEARTIGNLLPDDDDLFSGVDEFEGVPRSTNLDEDDIFGSVGGMEIEIDGLSSDRASKNTNMNCNGESTGANGAYFGQNSHGEHPSRTLFVQNINSGIEDDELRSLFERYGDVQMLYTACKHRGFVIISYYDIRSASNAMKQLQNKLLRHRKLDIHYSIPKDNPSEKDINQGAIAVSNLESSVSNDELRRIFGVYGEIKEIWESPQKDHQKILEFYDSRVAEATLRALDGKAIAGKQIKLEPSCPQFTTHCGLMQQFPSDIEQGEADICQRGSAPDSSAIRLGTTPVQMNASIGIDNVSLQAPFPVPRGPVNSIFDSASNGLPSNFPHLLSSPIPSVGNLDNQSGISGIEGALGSMNLSYQRMPNIHSHSLPERQNNFAMGILQNSPGIMQGMDANIGRRPEGINGRHVNGSLPYDHGGAFGTPGSVGCPLHGHQYPRNRFPSYNPPHLGHVMWQNSPPFFNNIAARSPTQMHGFPRTSSHMPNNMAPFPHHVGSAPTTNAALWDRRHGYAGDVMEGSAFHPSSLGSMGFSASPTLHQMDLASRNIYPFGDGSCMESPLPSSHIGIPSPQNCQMFGAQNPMIHFNSRYDAPNDRMRNRRSDSTANQGDNKKQFELDIERIVRGEDNRTTLMIKNIPNKYTSKMLLATIDEHHRGTYDFIYLPIDFKNKCNVGYAFINLIDPKKIIPFYETFNGKKWEKFNSEKVASLAYARIQGKSALVAHFQNSSLMNEDKRCRPILFHSDGPNAGDQEPFPMGTNVRSRTGRPRIHNNDEDQQGSPPSGFGGEETSNEFNSPPRSKKSGEI